MCSVYMKYGVLSPRQPQGTPKVQHECKEHKLNCEVFSEDGE